LPLLERVRIEVYLADLQIPGYENLLQSLTKEFTSAFGGCSIVRWIEGNYLSVLGNRILDRINLVYFDTPLVLSMDFAVVAAYSLQLKEVVMGSLNEEDVMISHCLCLWSRVNRQAD
jgi:hypothetical protein